MEQLLGVIRVFHSFGFLSAFRSLLVGPKLGIDLFGRSALSFGSGADHNKNHSIDTP